jgi:hypothetical protein
MIETIRFNFVFSAWLTRKGYVITVKASRSEGYEDRGESMKILWLTGRRGDNRTSCLGLLSALAAGLPVRCNLPFLFVDIFESYQVASGWRNQPVVFVNSWKAIHDGPFFLAGLAVPQPHPVAQLMRHETL